MRPSLDKTVLFIAASLPALALLWLVPTGGLGVNPIREGMHYTGDWAIRLLILALAITPAAKVSGAKKLFRYRRMIGLFAFFYGLLHVFTYVVLDHFFDVETIIKDIAKRPFITIGMGVFLILLALAVTSTHQMVRRLGARRWQALHRLVYLAGVGAAVHFTLSVKKDITESLIYGAIIAALLLARLLLRYELLPRIKIPAVRGEPVEP